MASESAKKIPCYLLEYSKHLLEQLVEILCNHTQQAVLAVDLRGGD